MRTLEFIGHWTYERNKILPIYKETTAETNGARMASMFLVCNYFSCVLSWHQLVFIQKSEQDQGTHCTSFRPDHSGKKWAKSTTLAKIEKIYIYMTQKLDEHALYIPVFMKNHVLLNCFIGIISLYFPFKKLSVFSFCFYFVFLFLSFHVI